MHRGAETLGPLRNGDLASTDIFGLGLFFAVVCRLCLLLYFLPYLHFLESLRCSSIGPFILSCTDLVQLYQVYVHLINWVASLIFLVSEMI